jgi:hypothetical protein
VYAERINIHCKVPEIALFCTINERSDRLRVTSQNDSDVATTGTTWFIHKACRFGCRHHLCMTGIKNTELMIVTELAEHLVVVSILSENSLRIASTPG